MANYIRWILPSTKRSTRSDRKMSTVFTRIYATSSIKNVGLNASSTALTRMLGKHTWQICADGNIIDILFILWQIWLLIHRMAAPEYMLCKCQSYPPLARGWEGSAILTHGTLVRFGCLAYVFAVIDTIIDTD